MIGQNIKSLRQSKALTQPEFANMIGISRNSLSRYENGTSSITIGLIDRICEKFDVSYLDIVGKDKLLTPLEEYQLSFKIETTKERGASLLAELFDFQNKQGITTDDDTNPWILMSDDLSELINTKIYLVENYNTLERYIGYIDGIEHMLEVAKGRVVA